MKSLLSKIRSLGMVVFGLGALVACSTETYDGLDYNQLPQASDIDVTVTVDPETNEFTLTLNNTGVYPVWTIHSSDTKTEISTRNNYKGIFTIAGSYPVEVRMGNRNGVSEGSKTIYIDIDHTIVDFTPYIKRLTNGDSKTWMFASDKSGHLGCGESGSDGLNWWSAQPYDKEGCGMYENRFIFTKTGDDGTGAYTYDPGTSGTIYVNTGVTSVSPYSDYNPNNGGDFAAPAQQQDTNFEIKVEGNDMYLVFPAGTLLGYLPNAEAYNEPKFKINSLTNDTVELTIDNGSIAWHYILGLEGDAPFSGFKYDSEFNLWRTGTIDAPWFWYAPGWNQIADPEYTLDGATYTFTFPEATTDTWQGQVHLSTNIGTTSASNYDFSAIISTNTDHPHVTIKLTSADSDDVYYFSDAITLKAGEDYIFYKSDMPGLDIAQLKLVLDFGGNAENTVATVSNIVLKDHANDDGTVLPSEDATETADVDWVAVDSDSNLWKGVSYSMFYYYAPGWSQIADPGFTDNGNSYTIDLPSATYDQWQAQVHFTTNIATSAANKYDFKVTLTSNTDLKGATVKLTKSDSDEIYYFTERVNLTAYDDITLKCVDMEGIDMDQVKLVFDFGGCQDGTVVEISNIVFQVHQGE